jgi:hypothetical protein
MTHDECRDSLALLALGAIEVHDRSAFHAHVAGCADCDDELKTLQEAAAQLALTAGPVAPTPGATERLLQTLDGRQVAISRRRRLRLIAVRLAIAAGVAFLVVSQVRLRQRLDAASVELQGMRSVGNFVMSPSVSVLPLWGRGTTHGKLAYDEATGRFALFSADLPPPPPDKQYRLWLIGDDVRRAATLAYESPTGVLRELPGRDRPFVFAVSMEPSGVVDEPTGPLLLLGRFAAGVEPTTR